MNLGIVSSRYAKALMKYSAETNATSKVYSDMLRLAGSFAEKPEIQNYLLNPSIKKEEKKSIIVAACGGADNVADATLRFIDLVIDNNRTELFRFIANDFVSLYCENNNIVPAKLTIASPVNKTTEDRLKKIVQKYSKGDVDMVVRVDNSLEGGFVLEFDTYRIDASVRTRTRNIKRELMSFNETSK